MNRLADVELQLVMHLLQPSELTRLACCSRQLFHAADLPFAWRHAPMMWLDLAHTAAARPSRLLRHARTSLRWTSTALSLPDNVVTALVGSTLHLHELDASRYARIEPSQWLRLLSAPALRGVRVLRLHQVRRPKEERVAEVVRAICSLPSLHTLDMRPLMADALLWAKLLPTAPSLTALTIADSNKNTDSTLTHLALCRGLRQLSLRTPCLEGKLFRATLGSPGLSQLESLHIDGLFARPQLRSRIPTEDFAAVFASLRRMQSITLRYCGGIDLLLPHMPAALALRRLHIETLTVAEGVAQNASVPSVPALMQLLTAMQNLQCELILPSTALYPGMQAQNECAFTAVQQAFDAPRFSLRFLPLPEPHQRPTHFVA